MLSFFRRGKNRAESAGQDDQPRLIDRLRYHVDLFMSVIIAAGSSRCSIRARPWASCFGPATS